MPLPQQDQTATPGLAWTGAELIASALRLIGTMASGDTLDGQEANDALAVLNQMIEEWSAQKLLIFTNSPKTFALQAGKQAYTMGQVAGATPADFDTPRPPFIERMTIQSLQNPASPLDLPLDMLTDEEWAAIPVKNVASSLARQVWDDGGFPLRTLSFWPIPTLIQNVTIYGWTALSSFSDLATPMSFPPGYLKAIRYNLAVDLAAEWPGNPQSLPIVTAIARTSKAVLKSLNAPIVKQTCETSFSGQQGHYNWLTDGFQK
jgi:hypothetical protein